MSEFDYPVPETSSEKLKRKLREDPFVPIGVIGTIAFLGAGFRAFQRGQAGKSQLMMRGRLLAQVLIVFMTWCSGFYVGCCALVAMYLLFVRVYLLPRRQAA